MPGDSDDDSVPAPDARRLPGPGELHHYPTHNLVTWHPNGVLDDLLLDEIGDWLCSVEKASPQFQRYIDFSRLQDVAVRVRHVFDFARKRASQLAGAPPIKSALFCEEWVGYGIARMYQDLMAETPLEVRAFRERAKAAAWLGVPVEVLTLEEKPPPAD